MNSINEIKDDEIRILGSQAKSVISRSRTLWLIAFLIAFVALTIGGVLYWNSCKNEVIIGLEDTKPSISEPNLTLIENSFIDVGQQTVNDVPMYIYTPVAKSISLQIGAPDTADLSVIFIVQAADVRADNGGIVSEFVVRGELLAKGSAKAGYCAIIDNHITVGIGKQTPLLNEAIGKQGYFFRQYPLVDNGVMVENAPKGKAIRRALVERRGEISVVESRSAESFHDFAQALVDLECKNAIYLCGSSAYGWYRGSNETVIEFGISNPDKSPMTNYMVWRK